MKFSQETKPNAEVVKAVNVELNEEQLDIVAGGQSVFQDWLDKVANIFKSHD